MSPLFEQRLHRFFSTDYGSIEAIPVSRPQALIYPLHDHQLQIPISLQDDASPTYNKTITEFIFAGTDQQWLRSSQVLEFLFRNEVLFILRFQMALICRLR